MASSGKRKTTMAKLNRERALLERRAQKAARKVARKETAGDEPLYGPIHREGDAYPSNELPD
jgi:hypothetical protein